MTIQQDRIIRYDPPADIGQLPPGSNNTLLQTSGAGVVQFAAATNAMLGADVGRINQLVNGGAEYWRRGAGPFTTTGKITADCWKMNIGTGSSLSISKDTVNVDTGSGACFTITHTYGTGASNLIQNIENALQLRGRTITLSVRANMSTAGRIRVYIYDNINAHTYSVSNASAGFGGYETLTVTKTIAATATLVQVGVSFDGTVSGYIDSLMLVPGSVAANYVPLAQSEELVKLNRYYEDLLGSASDIPLAGMQDSTTVGYFPWHFRTQKAVTPTINISAISDFGVYYKAGADTGALSNLTAFSTTVQGTVMAATAGGAYGAAGDAVLLHGRTGTAQISAEANI